MDSENARSDNPKILHRVYFDDMPPYNDRFLHYMETWSREMPDYKIMKWNSSNVDLGENEWMIRATKANSPVYLSEYVRWKVLSEYGGVYLDADCEILNGGVLSALVDQLYTSNEYDAMLGVEEYNNGFPTAQTVAAKPGSDLVRFMLTMYSKHLGSPLWHWREERLLIGPQLISLYFRENGHTLNKGFFPKLRRPEVACRVKVYPQTYFSPKFTTTGAKIDVSENTCVYHLFANLNIETVDPEAERHRKNPLLFNEYCEYLSRHYKASYSSDQINSISDLKYKVKDQDGRLNYLRLFKLVLTHPVYVIRKWLSLRRRSMT